ncbi:hypothetical protein CLU79DRAFT_805155 [Phycomyces nitens]|nr:hypothetical protein CLU79DRAFT_805155 [Phycomyces nitens]
MAQHYITGIIRYDNDEYTNIKATHSHDDIEKHFDCPTCIVHFMEIGELKTHYYANHLKTLPKQSQTTSHEEPTTGQQQSYNNQGQPNKPRLSNVLRTELLDPLSLSFSPLDHDDHLLVQNFDATMAFHKLQPLLCQHKWKLSLENHIHCALVATHILLLSQNQYPEDLSPYFNNHDLKATINGIEAKYSIKKLPIRDKAITRLLDLGLPTNENKFKNCIIDLIRKLPPVPIAKDIKELELCTRYHKDLSTKKCPDICISRLHGMAWATNHGYGEVKSAAQGGNNYSICQDLLCVGVFCKNALDTQNMEGLYVMYELEKIKIPSCLYDFTKLIVDMTRVCRVLETFNHICKPSVHQAIPSRHRPTITTHFGKRLSEH